MGEDFSVETVGGGDVDVAKWVMGALKGRRERAKEGEGEGEKPALHKAPLDVVSPGAVGKAIGELKLAGDGEEAKVEE